MCQSTQRNFKEYLNFLSTAVWSSSYRTAGSWTLKKDRAGLWGGPAGQLPGAPTYKGRQDVTGIIWNMVLVNSGFHMRKNFFENYPPFGHAPSRRFASPVLNWELLACSASPHVSGRPCKRSSISWLVYRCRGCSRRGPGGQWARRPRRGSGGHIFFWKGNRYKRVQ